MIQQDLLQLLVVAQEILLEQLRKQKPVLAKLCVNKWSRFDTMLWQLLQLLVVAQEILLDHVEPGELLDSVAHTLDTWQATAATHVQDTFHHTSKRSQTNKNGPTKCSYRR